MLDLNHAEHLQGEVDQVRGLVEAMQALDSAASEAPASEAAARAIKIALHRALDDVTALIEGYTEPPDLA